MHHDPDAPSISPSARVGLSSSSFTWACCGFPKDCTDSPSSCPIIIIWEAGHEPAVNHGKSISVMQQIRRLKHTCFGPPEFLFATLKTVWKCEICSIWIEVDDLVIVFSNAIIRPTTLDVWFSIATCFGIAGPYLLQIQSSAGRQRCLTMPPIVDRTFTCLAPFCPGFVSFIVRYLAPSVLLQSNWWESHRQLGHIPIPIRRASWRTCGWRWHFGLISCRQSDLVRSRPPCKCLSYCIGTRLKHTCFGLPELEDSRFIKHTNLIDGTVREYNIGDVWIELN